MTDRVQEFLRDVVPAALFHFKEDGDLLQQAQHLIDQCHPKSTGMRLSSLAPEQATATIPYAQENRALHGLMHGGCLFTVGDTITAIMCMFHVEHRDERMLTISASIRYLRPVDRDTVRAEARLLRKRGRQLEFVCDFFNEAGKRSAQGKYRYVLARLPGSGAA